MGDKTTISWAMHTFNGWVGCQKVGPGCDNCYALSWDERFSDGIHWGPGAPRRRTTASNWRKPRRWNRDAIAEGRRARVFSASLSDVFDNAVDAQWRKDLAALIRETPALDWMLLTKRIGNVPRMVAEAFGAEGLPDNVWLGASIVTQEEADRDIAKLLAVPAAVHWLSMEPLVEAVAVDPAQMAGLDMIVVGGESGGNARHFDIEWARDLLRQARAGDTAFHMKQLSQHDHPSDYDDFNAIPKDLQVREYPKGTYPAYA